MDDTYEDDKDDNHSCETNNEDKFEKQYKNVATNTMVQNLLSFEQKYMII